MSILALLIWLAPTLGQRGTELISSYDISQYGHTAWTVQSGSFRGGLTTITQTSDGYLWLGTTFGLVRFDGVRFTEWSPPQTGDSLPEPGVLSLLGARDGSLWIGRLMAGLTQWKNGRLIHFPELDGGSVFAILEDHEGTIWIGGGKENKTLCRIRSGVLGCLEDEKVRNAPVSALYQDREGRVWAYLISRQLCEVQLDNPRCYPDPNGAVRDIVEDVDGRLVLAEPTGLRFLSRNGKIEDYPLRLDSQVRSILMDREGGLWVGTDGKGLVHVREGRVDTFTKDNGLSSNANLYKILEDREGTVWVASLNSLDRFRKLAIPTMTKRQGLSSDYPLSILSAQDGTIWLGTQNGLNHLKNNTIKVYDKHDGLADYTDSMLQISDGRLLAESGGLCWVVENGRAIKIPVDIGQDTFGIVEDARGDIWLMSNIVGLVHLSKAGTVIEKFAKQTFHLRLLQLAYDPVRDGLWLSTKDGNLAFFKSGKIIEHYGPDDGLGTGPLIDVQVKKDGTVWVSTRVGLARLRNGKIAILDQKAGLPCNATHWIRADDEGNFWLYTECGIVHLSQEDLAAWDAQPNHRVTPLDFFNNMDGAENHSLGASWYSPPVTKTSDGRLLFIQNSGVGIIDPRHIARNVLPPPVHIEGMIADRKNYPAQDNLSLPALTRDLEIDYTALSLVVPEKVRFRYILEGHDTDWQDPGNRRQAFYNDLRPGNYTFRVIACNNDGVWNKTGASLIFRVAPAWYQTYWFLLLCTVTGLIVVWAIYNLRVRQIARAISVRFDERLAERTRIARELHDTLLQTVQGSKLVADNALEKPNDAGHLHQAMRQLSGWLGQATQEGRAALNSLRTSTMDTNDLVEGLRRATEECVIDQSMAVKFSATGGPRDLHPIAREEIYRIGYEAIRNACEHASASELEIVLTYAQDLTLRVSDNGSGMEAAVATEGREGHFGLQGMRERAERIGSKFTLKSAPNSGTEITLVVPGNIIFQETNPTQFKRLKTFFGFDGSSDRH